MTGVLLSKCAFENKLGGADVTPHLNNIYLIKLYHNYCIWHTCVTWQSTNYELPEDDTTVSKYVGRVW